MAWSSSSLSVQRRVAADLRPSCAIGSKVSIAGSAGFGPWPWRSRALAPRVDRGRGGGAGSGRLHPRARGGLQPAPPRPPRALSAWRSRHPRVTARGRSFCRAPLGTGTLRGHCAPRLRARATPDGEHIILVRAFDGGATAELLDLEGRVVEEAQARAWEAERARENARAEKAEADKKTVEQARKQAEENAATVAKDLHEELIKDIRDSDTSLRIEVSKLNDDEIVVQIITA